MGEKEKRNRVSGRGRVAYEVGAPSRFEKRCRTGASVVRQRKNAAPPIAGVYVAKVAYSLSVKLRYGEL
jgi:hypothetical protein